MTCFFTLQPFIYLQQHEFVCSVRVLFCLVYLKRMPRAGLKPEVSIMFFEEIRSCQKLKTLDFGKDLSLFQN